MCGRGIVLKPRPQLVWIVQPPYQYCIQFPNPLHICKLFEQAPQNATKFLNDTNNSQVSIGPLLWFCRFLCLQNKKRRCNEIRAWHPVIPDIYESWRSSASSIVGAFGVALHPSSPPWGWWAPKPNPIVFVCAQFTSCIWCNALM